MRWLRPLKYRLADYVVEPSAEDYHRLIDEGFACSDEQAKTLRLLAWWRENDWFRDDSSPRSGNLRALSELLNEDNERECMLKAEVLREAGQFRLALEVLDRHPESDFAEGVAEIRRLSLAGEREVKRFFISQRKSDSEKWNRERKKDEQTRRDLEARIDAARRKAIEIGLATPENVEAVLRDMSVGEFQKHFSEFRVSRGFFGSGKKPSQPGR